jgi:tripeptidyl-peptidase-1
MYSWSLLSISFTHPLTHLVAGDLIMHVLQITLLGPFAAQTAAIPFTNYVVHERCDYVPKSWMKRGNLDSAAELPVRIGLTQSNLDRGRDLLMEV